MVAIREILRNVTAPSEPEFEAAACTYDRAVFSQPGEALAIQPRGLSFSGREQEFVLPEQGPKMFLRLLPMIPTEPLSKQQALAYLRQARLEPFALRSITGGELDGRNKYGAIVYRPTRDGPVIEDLTQLFKDHELWRLTCTLLSYQSERHLPHTFEHGFIQALGRYTSSPKRHCGWRFQFG